LVEDETLPLEADVYNQTTLIDLYHYPGANIPALGRLIILQVLVQLLFVQLLFVQLLFVQLLFVQLLFGRILRILLSLAVIE